MNLINFVLIRQSIFGHFDTFPGVGGWGKIENKDHLSPAKAEIGAELGKNKTSKNPQNLSFASVLEKEIRR